MSAFYDDQPDAVRAVIAFADMREHGADPKFDLIARTVLPARDADLILDVAESLHWIERLETELAADVLSDYHGRPVHGFDLDRAADVLADDKRGDVLRQAQLVASDLSIWLGAPLVVAS